MSILCNKRVVILGLGNHGGGVASAHFACSNGASHIFISDMQSEEKLAPALKQLQSVLSFPHVDLETGTHSIEKIVDADIVIKNPAIPRTAPVMRACMKRGVAVETDISLFLRELIVYKKSERDSRTPLSEKPHVIAVTGTKGKSSITHAIHMWNTQCGLLSTCAGNITYPVLKLLMDKTKAISSMTIVLELSSFQLGDLNLVQQNNPSCSLYKPISLAILSNILPDHQNYYASMREYAEDKLSLFCALPRHVCKIMPYELQTSEYSEKLPMLRSAHENNIVWHSQKVLPDAVVGAWVGEDALVGRMGAGEETKKICDLRAIPKHIPLQNSVVFALSCEIQNQPCPQTAEQWTHICAMPHRKEYVRTYKGRVFYNDSAASIPQAMQLSSFQKQKGVHLHVIAGGTDKNLNAACFLKACSVIASTHLSVHFLDGTYTNKIMPLTSAVRWRVFGPFNSLEESVQSALHHSKAGDVIVLSPGCTSFGLFIHEFHRGEVFKKIVHSL